VPAFYNGECPEYMQRDGEQKARMNRGKEEGSSGAQWVFKSGIGVKCCVPIQLLKLHPKRMYTFYEDKVHTFECVAKE